MPSSLPRPIATSFFSIARVQRPRSLLVAFLFNTPLPVRCSPLYFSARSPPSTLPARLPPIIIFNSPWCSVSATFSLPVHRYSSPVSLPLSLLPLLPFYVRLLLLFERYAWIRKKLGNIISETEGTRLLAVPISAAAAVSLIVSAS